MDPTDNFYTVVHFEFYMFIMYTTYKSKNSMPRYRTERSITEAQQWFPRKCFLCVIKFSTKSNFFL